MKVLITGAASGIGYGLAVKLIKHGHKVYLCVHNENEIRAVIDKTKGIEDEDRISVIKLDVTSEVDRKLIKKLDVDCLVTMAAVGCGGSLLNMNVSDIRNNFETNFFSTLELIKLYIETRSYKKGKVVVVSSMAGMFSIPFLGSYCSTKAALSSFIVCLHREIKYSNLLVNIKLIEPGAYKTGFNQFMIDGKNELDNKHFIKPMKDISNMQRKQFDIVESKNLDTIVRKMYRAILSDSNKLVYRAPIFQQVVFKLYTLFVK